MRMEREEARMELIVQEEAPTHNLIHRMQIFRVKLMHFVNSLHNYIMTRVSTTQAYGQDLHNTGL